MIIYFDTVRRKRPVREGGELIKLDWAAKKVIRAVPIFPNDPDIIEDPNPRGNSRGGKGILITEDELFVGSYHTILVFDHELNLRRKITNDLFVNIHEMCFAGDGSGNIWVSSTTIDCAVLVDREGRTVKSWWPREEPVLQEKFGLTPMEIDKTADNRLKYIHAELGQKESHTHLNSVTKSGKNTYALLNRLGAVVRIEPGVSVVLEDRLLRGAHSPAVSADGKHMFVCSSFSKNILVFDLETGRMKNQIHLLDFDTVAGIHKEYPDRPFNKSIFVRGLEIIDDSRVLVGISPASILEIDVRENKLLDFYRYSSEVGDAVHGLVHLR